MNSDYAPIVKKIRDEADINTLLLTQDTNTLEKRIGYGKSYLPIMYSLLLGNSVIYAQRYGYLQSRNFFLASVILSWPVACLITPYVFGNKKYRDLAERDRETVQSANLFKNITEKKE
jgi:hypothetical protein